MKYNLRQGVALAAMCMVLIACGSDPKVEPGGGGGGGGGSQTHADAEANKWIYAKMAKEYLYNSKAKGMTTPNYAQTCEDFFKSLLSADLNDNDGKHTDGQDYFYSYMERTDSKAMSRIASGVSTCYGIEYILYATNASRTEYYARVLYTAKNSVAETAGVKRGDWIAKIDGKAVTKANYKQLDNGGGTTLVAERTIVENGVEKKVSLDFALPAATSIDNSPVFLDKVVTVNGHKIGYLVFNAFETGPQGFSDKSYEAELKAAFGRLKTAGVTDMVLDLRYNPGGYLSTCTLLASMIAPSTALFEIFSIEKYNTELTVERGDNTTRLLNVSEIGAYNINQSKLYVLTGMWTASASEMIINGLRPFMDVVLIGAKTEGKNVGSYPITSTTHKLHLQPITFRIYNGRNESNYAQGFTPEANFYNDELDDQTQMYPLGDPQEYLLSMAIGDITGAPQAVTQKTRTAVSKLAPTRLSSLNNRKVKGLIDGSKSTIE